MSIVTWVKGLFGATASGEFAPPVDFGFEQRPSSLFGSVYRPMADVDIWSEENNRWERIRMIIDTGADYTFVPRYVALLIGLNLNDTQKLKVEGIGGAQTVYFWEKARVKIGDHQRTIPISIADSNTVPSLMGRQLFFETFNVEFTGRKKIQFRSLQ
jgi:predicted aspartyl protease